MNGMGHKLFAGSRFAADEHRRGTGGDALDHFIDLVHLVASADDIFKTVMFFELLSQMNVLFDQRLFLRLAQLVKAK